MNAPYDDAPAHSQPRSRPRLAFKAMLTEREHERLTRICHWADAHANDLTPPEAALVDNLKSRMTRDGYGMIVTGREWKMLRFLHEKLKPPIRR